MTAPKYNIFSPYSVTLDVDGRFWIGQNGVFYDIYGNVVPDILPSVDGYHRPHYGTSWFDFGGTFLVRPDGTLVSITGGDGGETIDGGAPDSVYIVAALDGGTPSSTYGNNPVYGGTP